MSERKITQLVLPYVTQHRTYIDVGAASGDTAVPFVNLFATIHAFEPNVTEANKIPKTINVHHCALADYDGTTELIQPPTNNPEHASIAPQRIQQWHDTTIIDTVPVKTLDSFAIDDVDLIKIDVEQGEHAVVLGAEQTIRKQHPVVFYENKRHENNHINELLTAWGYDIITHKADCLAVYPS